MTRSTSHPMLEILNLRSVRPEGNARPFWAAELVNDTVHVSVDNRYGSWQADANGNRRGVLPAAAEQLQARIRLLEAHQGWSDVIAPARR
jgi:hypothetical protein